jgi:hypothetical protein
MKRAAQVISRKTIVLKPLQGYFSYKQLNVNNLN